jgi:tripartite-type tricarboxylate transporter receptor subunit TctC
LLGATIKVAEKRTGTTPNQIGDFPMQFLTFLVATLSIWSNLAGAQANYPDKPITVIVPFPPGIVDSYARNITTKASSLLGQPFVIRNQPGAGQRIGTEALAKASADGYTIGVLTNAGVVAGPALATKVPYDPINSFTYLTLSFESHYLINTHPASGIKTLAQLIARAKAAPGSLTFGSTGTGTGFHLATEQFVNTAGLNMLHIPYKGETPLIADLIGGQVIMGFSSLATRSMIDAGRLVPLAYTGERRSSLLPAVPTAREQGVPHVSSGWLGFAAPAGLPATVQQRLLAALSAANTDPEIIATFTKAGLEPRNIMGEAFENRVRQELESVRELNNTLKLTIE